MRDPEKHLEIINAIFGNVTNEKGKNIQRALGGALDYFVRIFASRKQRLTI